MKTCVLTLSVLLVAFSACNTEIKTNGQKVTFGIYECVKSSEIPVSIMDSIRLLNIQFENDSPIVGYVAKNDSLVIAVGTSKEKIKLVKTCYPVDGDKKLSAVVAVSQQPVIDNSHIKRTKNRGDAVEIYFNQEGASRWAELTRQRTGNTVTFIIDDQVYAMPFINSQIKNGVAVIEGLGSVDLAKAISESLNSSIVEATLPQ